MFENDNEHSCCEDIFRKAIYPDNIDHALENLDWQSVSNFWSTIPKPNRPFNGHLASIAFLSEKSATTCEPLNLTIQIDVTNAHEPESGVELYFNTVSIVPLFDKISYESVEYAEPESSIFRVGGTENFRKVYLSARDNMGLSGEYTSETMIKVHPERGSYEFSASLNVSVLNTNLIPPDDLELDSKEKRELIKRMVEKEVLPKPDAAGNVLLHEVSYTVNSAKRHRK